MQTKSFSYIFVGLAVLAAFVLPVAVFAQGGSGIENPLSGGAETITDVLVGIIRWLLGLVGIVALIALIWGGFQMVTGFGNDDKIKKAKTTIVWAVIGLMVIILSYAFIRIVTSEILGGGGGGSSSDGIRSPSDRGPGNREFGR